MIMIFLINKPDIINIAGFCYQVFSRAIAANYQEWFCKNTTQICADEDENTLTDFWLTDSLVEMHFTKEWSI